LPVAVSRCGAVRRCQPRAPAASRRLPFAGHCTLRVRVASHQAWAMSARRGLAVASCGHQVRAARRCWPGVARPESRLAIRGQPSRRLRSTRAGRQPPQASVSAGSRGLPRSSIASSRLPALRLPVTNSPGHPGPNAGHQPPSHPSQAANRWRGCGSGGAGLSCPQPTMLRPFLWRRR
jgi:hypothetical protein